MVQEDGGPPIPPPSIHYGSITIARNAVGAMLEWMQTAVAALDVVVGCIGVNACLRLRPPGRADNSPLRGNYYPTYQSLIVSSLIKVIYAIFR